MIADRTVAASSPSRMIPKAASCGSSFVLLKSDPLDIAFSLPLDVERRHLIIAADFRQGVHGRPETTDPGTGQVADGETLVDKGLAALEVDAVVNRDLQVEGIDLDEFEVAGVAEEPAGEADLCVVLDAGPDGIRLIDLKAVLVAEGPQVILDRVLVGPLAKDPWVCPVA